MLSWPGKCFSGCLMAWVEGGWGTIRGPPRAVPRRFDPVVSSSYRWGDSDGLLIVSSCIEKMLGWREGLLEAGHSGKTGCKRT